jgi:hypothetical protein
VSNGQCCMLSLAGKHAKKCPRPIVCRSDKNCSGHLQPKIRTAHCSDTARSAHKPDMSGKVTHAVGIFWYVDCLKAPHLNLHTPMQTHTIYITSTCVLCSVYMYIYVYIYMYIYIYMCVCDCVYVCVSVCAYNVCAFSSNC